MTKATVDAYQKLCDIIVMFYNQAVEQYQLKATNQQFNGDLMNAALRDARDACGILIRYQRPSLKALLVADPMGILGMAQQARPVDGTVVAFPTDAASAARAYQRMMMAASSVPAVANGK